MAFLSGSVPAVNSAANVSNNIFGHYALIRTLVQFLNGAGIVDYSSIVATTSGDGTIDYVDTIPPALNFGLNVAETWTITFTSSTAFNVSGSVSGAQTAGVVGTDYTSDTNEIFFLINQGTSGNEWAAADTIVFSVSANGNTATNDKYEIMTTANPTANLADRQVILRSIGLGGTDEVYHNVAAFKSGSPSDRWWFHLRGMTGFNPAGGFDNHPGISPFTWTPFWDGAMNYWLVANGRRYILVAQVAGTMHTFYSGLMLPFSTPTEYPYPLVIGGESLDPFINWGPTAGATRHFVDSNGAAIVRAPDGSYVFLDSDDFAETQKPKHVWPWIGTTLPPRQLLGITETWNTDHSLWPATVMSYANTGVGTSGLLTEVYGTLDGVYAVNGLATSPAATINVGGQNYLVVNQIAEVNSDDFWALELA